MACWIHEYGDWSYIDPADGTRRINFQFKICMHCGKVKKRIVK